MEGSGKVLLEALPRLGRWLRELSLSGPGGNAAAWAVVLALAALPALGLLWRGRCRWDWLLALAGGEILGGLFFLVNPTLLGVPLEGEPAAKLWGLTVAGGTGTVLLAWAVLRWLRALERGASGRSVERLLSWAALLAGALAILAQGLDLAGKLQNVASSNTAPGLDLVPTYLTLCLLAAADLVPSLLGCAVLRWGGRLAAALEADPFAGATVALAERVRVRCGWVAAASVLVCAGESVVQMVLFPVLHTASFTVSFPFFTVLLAAVLGLLCQYFRRAKAVSDDNGTII
ncbi:MAG: hypothetical protein HFF67_03150 [Oscillospiraceae bacterium]|nr:hypothetical protein [Oscillospiraceae bacterium]MDE6934255.1 hypothetical protein [Oscillospiraceae bacterium]